MQKRSHNSKYGIGNTFGICCFGDIESRTQQTRRQQYPYSGCQFRHVKARRRFSADSTGFAEAAVCGTPPNIQGIANLEKPLGKPREPFYAPKGTTNVAFKKSVKSSDEQPIIGEIEMITDGDKEATDGSYVELGPLKQNVTIDLGASYNVYAVVVWHYHKIGRAHV